MADILWSSLGVKGGGGGGGGGGSGYKILNSQSSAVGFGNGADVTEDTLFTYTMPAGTLTAGHSILLTVGATLESDVSGDDCTILTYFGASAYLGIDLNAAVLGSYVGQGQVWCINNTTFNFTGIDTLAKDFFTSTPIIPHMNPNRAIPDLSVNPVIIKVTGQSPSGTAREVIAYDFQVVLI